MRLGHILSLFPPQAKRTSSIVASFRKSVAIIEWRKTASDDWQAYVAATPWGIGWGGAPTLMQTAVADAGSDQADAAKAIPARR
jgi:hypothetical protein